MRFARLKTRTMGSTGALLLFAACCTIQATLPLPMTGQTTTTASIGITGTVTDTTGAIVTTADVTATSLNSGAITHVTTDASGAYTLAGLKPGKYKLTIVKPGFKSFEADNLVVAPNQVLAENATMIITSVGTTVDVVGDLPGTTAQPTQEDVFESDAQIRVLDRKEIETAGPVAGAAQIVANTPGANVTGYGDTGATKYTVGINGVSQGWGGYGGYSGGGAIAITFDGVPIVDPATNLWQSPTIPEQFMIQNANVTYGPGDPATRWFNNVGGMIEFTPVQPSAAKRPHLDISGTYGSFNVKDLSANFTTGVYRGWSGVIAAGVGSGNDFRNAPDGFQNPGKDLAFFGKVIKSYGNNSFEAGGYYAHGAGYRSQVIPIVANPLITVDGTPTGQQYSQQTSGYYSTLPYASYEKYDTNEDGLAYARATVQLDPTTRLENLSWYNHIARSHDRMNDVYNTGAQQYEWNSPYTDTVGNRLSVTKRLPFNTITVSGYYLSALYNSRNNFYNPANGGAKRVANIGGKVRSSNFDQSDFAISVQDEFRIGTRFTLTPGLRYVGFRTGYSDVAAQDFTLAPGAAFATHCAANQTSYNPNDPTQNPNNPNGNKISVKDQGSTCAGLENRSGAEPSVNATVRTLPWLQLYGGFMEALRSPQVGGGGGLFQSVDPASYHLSRQMYSQGGFKIHHEGSGALNTALITGTYYFQNWANQEIDTTLANGNAVSANGTSQYKGFNASFDDDPYKRLHIFANANIETATYTNYTTVIPLGSSQPQQDFNGLHVPYVPNSTVNAGAFYETSVGHDLKIDPMVSFSYIGSQYIFDNNAVDSAGNAFPRPSSQKMSGYGTVNAGIKAPYKFVDFNFNALNLFNNKYNIYQYISSGGYFGTAGNGPGTEGSGYQLAYPGAPITVYGGVTAHF